MNNNKKTYQEKNDQQMIRKFYKEFLSWKAENIGLWIAAGFLEMLFLIFMAIPLRDYSTGEGIEAATILLAVLFGWLAPLFYIMPYIAFKEGADQSSISAKLKYLPVDIREIQKMRVIYLTKFVVKLFPMALLLQLCTSWYSYHAIGWQNICYVVGAALIWPLISNLPIAIFSRRFS